MNRFPRTAAAALVAIATLAVLPVASAPSAHAAPATWTIDVNHSTVGFSIRHLFSRVHGTFAKFTGAVVYDPANPTASSVKAEIDASSVTTNNDTRDKDLRSDDFFDVAKYPTITFESTKVTAGADKKLQVAGNLTMHGITKPVTLDVSFLGSGKGPMGEDRVGFEATTTIDRKDFDIIWNRNLDQGGTLLGDDVTIALSIEGYVRPAMPGEKKADSASK